MIESEEKLISFVMINKNSDNILQRFVYSAHDRMVKQMKIEIMEILQLRFTEPGSGDIKLKALRAKCNRKFGEFQENRGFLDALKIWN